MRIEGKDRRGKEWSEPQEWKEKPYLPQRTGGDSTAVPGRLPDCACNRRGGQFKSAAEHWRSRRIICWANV